MNKLALSVLLLLIGGSALAQGRVITLDTIDGDSSHTDGKRNPARTVIPEYPRQAWLERIEGGVQVCFYVTRGGRPYSIAVRHSDHKAFERPAREAVKISWFEAIPRSEKVPPIKSCRTFQFRLEALETDES
jgi:TonB family protein